MKKLGRFCALVILTLSITLTSYAGHIDCPGITASQPTAAGEMQNGVTAAGETPNNITDTLILLLVALV